jgi:hypothetical protein
MNVLLSSLYHLIAEAPANSLSSAVFNLLEASSSFVPANNNCVLNSAAVKNNTVFLMQLMIEKLEGFMAETFKCFIITIMFVS